jgi:site-specific recombinase XerD
MLSQFAQGREERSIASIRTADIEEWLADHASTPGYRQTWINRLSALFSFAKRQEWVIQNPCDRVEKVVIDRKRPQILTVEQAKVCVTFVRDEMPHALGWLVLALFCGLRPEEADKISWSDIDLEKGVVTVDAAASKVRWRRLVYCTPGAAKWLGKAKAKNATLPIAHQAGRRVLRSLRAKLGFATWPKDILRHTAASVLMATWEDEGRVAATLGNSPTILHAHYRRYFIECGQPDEVVRRCMTISTRNIDLGPVPRSYGPLSNRCVPTCRATACPRASALGLFSGCEYSPLLDFRD